MADPLCPYFGRCGGCALQRIDYSDQLENKKSLLAKSLKFSRIKVFSGKEYFYRNRMDFIFHRKGLGLRVAGKWDKIIDVERCVISNEAINSLLVEVRGHFRECDYFDIIRNRGTFKYAILRAGKSDSSITFVLNEDSPNLGEAVEKVKEFSKSTTAKNVSIAYVGEESSESVSEDYFATKGRSMLREDLMGREFTYPVQGFFQNNPEVAEKMLGYVNGLLEHRGPKAGSLLDLYGGVGAFGITNSHLFEKVAIVDNSKVSIEAAKSNIHKHKTANCEAFAMDSKHVKRLRFEDPLFVIVDPPRSGMDFRTIEELRKMEPKSIIYISCNVAQLAKELLRFKEFSIKSAALFDMFPQTNHVEAVVELEIIDVGNLIF